jgi:hypothetical protein
LEVEDGFIAETDYFTLITPGRKVP